VSFGSPLSSRLTSSTVVMYGVLLGGWGEALFLSKPTPANNNVDVWFWVRYALLSDFSPGALRSLVLTPHAGRTMRLPAPRPIRKPTHPIWGKNRSCVHVSFLFAKANTLASAYWFLFKGTLFHWVFLVHWTSRDSQMHNVEREKNACLQINRL